ncbi:MAG: acyl-CoA thioesterase [Trichococcus sp.]
MKNELKPYIHVAQYYETDQMKIIHHSNYIRWFEEARIDFLDQIGANYANLEANGIVSPVLTVEAQYKAMVRYGDSVYVLPEIHSYNGIKLSLTYRVIDVATGELRTTGKSQHCFLNEENRPVSLKKDQPHVHANFEKYRDHIFSI